MGRNIERAHDPSVIYKKAGARNTKKQRGRVKHLGTLSEPSDNMLD